MRSNTTFPNRTGLAPHPKILGVRVDPITVEELNQYIASVVTQNEKALVLNVNVHCLNLAQEISWLTTFLNSAEIVFCDGAGVRLGARLLGYDLPERITYAEWMWQLAAYAEKEHISFFFLGGRPGTPEKAAIKLVERFPNLMIKGCHHGYFNKTKESPENIAVVELINSSRADILVTGFGMPIQERWLMENWDQINANVALTGGAVFDYVSGDLRRAPSWMTGNGLEWLGRLLIEPHRLWKRYLLGNPLFLLRIIRQRIMSGVK